MCNDGTAYNNYYVFGFSDAYDNYFPEEDSIDIMKSKDAHGGISLYESDIKSIELATA
jgi:hypothetical protein